MLALLLRRQRLEKPGLRGTIAARGLDRLGQHPGRLRVLAGAIQGDAVGVQGLGVALRTTAWRACCSHLAASASDSWVADSEVCSSAATAALALTGSAAMIAPAVRRAASMSPAASSASSRLLRNSGLALGCSTMMRKVATRWASCRPALHDRRARRSQGRRTRCGG